MARPVFDKEQYELRGRLPRVYTEAQETALNDLVSRVNGQLDWNAQLLGFNGNNYWGRRISSTDGSYEWNGLAETVAEKRAVQAGAFGVYNKDKPYADRPAPFRRDAVNASADSEFHVYISDRQTKITPIGQPEGLLYASEPVLFVGAEYTFDKLVEVAALNGASSSLFITDDYDQGTTTVRLLDSAPNAISIQAAGTDSAFLFFVREWSDVSDWTGDETLAQFIGVWGNKGNAISAHFLFDSLDLHGFNEQEGLTLDDISFELDVVDLLDKLGLKSGPGTRTIADYYRFKVEDCGEFQPPVIAPDQPAVSQFGVCETADYKLSAKQYLDGSLVELSKFSFDYKALSAYGAVKFPCVEWIFDPSLDNSTYPIELAEPAWMGVDDGEYGTILQQSSRRNALKLDCVGDEIFDGILTFDDGKYDKAVEPDCAQIDASPPNCSTADGGFYELGNPLVLPLSNTICGVECGLVDSGVYDTAESLIEDAAVDEGVYSPMYTITNTPVTPCPIDPMTVQLGPEIFSAPAWRMRPSVANSLSPLRVWKNRVLNVSDSEVGNAFTNQLVADENTGPEDPSSFRQHVRLPAEYSRSGKYWQRAESIMANQAYFSRLLPTAPTALPIPDHRPLLYDETSPVPQSNLADHSVFYAEDFLISTVSDYDLSSQDNFLDAELSYEAAEPSLPFVQASVVGYDGYSERKLTDDGRRVGSYYKFAKRGRDLTGFLETDILEQRLRPVSLDEYGVNDAPEMLIPNVEFPDDPDTASFANYTVSYAYFAADLSVADDPVFDPERLFCHRMPTITSAGGDETTRSRYLIHDS